MKNKNVIVVSLTKWRNNQAQWQYEVVFWYHSWSGYASVERHGKLMQTHKEHQLCPLSYLQLSTAWLNSQHLDKLDVRGQFQKTSLSTLSVIYIITSPSIRRECATVTFLRKRQSNMNCLLYVKLIYVPSKRLRSREPSLIWLQRIDEESVEPNTTIQFSYHCRLN